MPTISLRRLSDETLVKYEQLEREGKLTPRQVRALAGHRMLPLLVEAAHRNAVEERQQREKDKANHD